MNGGNADFIIGGRSRGIAKANAEGNLVILNGGTVLNNIYGGSAENNTSFSTTAAALNNKVIVNNGTVMDKVVGGFSYKYLASFNIAEINGGNLNDIMGGMVYDPAGQAIHNTVTLRNSPNIKGSLYGGGVDGNSSATGLNYYTGNTLNIWNYSGSSVKNVLNFQNYNFILPSKVFNGFEYFSVNNTIDYGDEARITGLDIENGYPMSVGDEITLIKAQTALNSPKTIEISGKQGIFFLYDYDLFVTNNNLMAKIKNNPELNPQTKALSEAMAARIAFINQGADYISGNGLKMAVANSTGNHGFSAFGGITGGSSRLKSGSHVDIKGFNGLIGLSGGQDISLGRLTFGTFFEFGDGEYDSHNSFSNQANVNGSGDSSYLGVGFLTRLDFTNIGPGVFYAETAGRFGRAKSDFKSRDLYTTSGKFAAYDFSSNYFGFHTGFGYDWNHYKNLDLDLYTRYFWNRQKGKNVNILGDRVTFDDADSNRWRTGARLSFSLTDSVRPYAGAAYEYEFNGQADATVYGYALDAPKLKGSTGIGEAGLAIAKSDSFPLNIDLGVQGFFGKREGYSGFLQLKYEF